jgi:enamine deaminase RidA (YjgF/YER057c/UK114 family)
MDVTHLIKMTAFLTEPEQVLAHRQIRREFLGDHMPASTVVVRTLNPAWHLEIEAIAAAEI